MLWMSIPVPPPLIPAYSVAVLREPDIPTAMSDWLEGEKQAGKREMGVERGQVEILYGGKVSNREPGRAHGIQGSS